MNVYYKCQKYFIIKMSNVQSIIDKFEKSPENDPKIFKIILDYINIPRSSFEYKGQRINMCTINNVHNKDLFITNLNKHSRVRVILTRSIDHSVPYFQYRDYIVTVVY